MVQSLESDNVSDIMVTWFIQRLNTDLETLGAEEPLLESSLPLDETITQYVTRLHWIMCWWEFYI